jgi:CDP-diacylglycerol--serine O-phosphatidyltransferase
VAPALIAYQWSLKYQPTMGLLASFVFVAAGAIRLARFNVLAMDEGGKPQKPGKYVVGLPIPGAAGILISVLVATRTAQADADVHGYAWGVAGLLLLLAFLMISAIPFRSFKDLKLNLRTAMLVTVVVLASVYIWSRWKPAFVLVWLLAVYVLIGIVEAVVSIPKRLRERRHDSLPPTSV